MKIVKLTLVILTIHWLYNIGQNEKHERVRVELEPKSGIPVAKMIRKRAAFEESFLIAAPKFKDLEFLSSHLLHTIA